MAGTIQYASHANFFTGMVRDIPRHLIPDGAVFDATNIVITNSGSLAKRGAATTALSSASTMNPVEVGSQRSANTDGRSFLYPVEVTGGVLKFGSMPFSASTQVLSTFTSAIVLRRLRGAGGITLVAQRLIIQTQPKVLPLLLAGVRSR